MLGLIVVYVPLAGAGPSIQRAGVMGAVGVLATLAGRRASRLYALLLALGVTLAIDPGVAADIGWQLSFAAVTGIFLLAAPLRRAIAARLGPGALRRTVAEGAAVTIAATLATAPLIAFHFETLSTMTLVANLLAMPAVAPAMWLGMTVAAASQVPGLPVEALNWLNALLLGYIAQVADWCGRPSWAQIDIHLSLAGLAAAYAALAAAIVAAVRLARRRRLKRAADGPKSRAGGDMPAHRRRLLLAALGLVMVGLWWVARGAGGTGGARVGAAGRGPRRRPGRRDPAAAGRCPGGPGRRWTAGRRPRRQAGGRRGRAAGRGDRLPRRVRPRRRDRRTARSSSRSSRLVYARLGRQPLEAARAAGAVPVRAALGGELRSGGLRLEVLWPPRELLEEAAPGIDPNRLALVLLARWRDFSMLLTADAEAESVPLDPGPLDVLKVAHHGSDDAGLAALLDRTAPRLAVISVGADNSYGHPTAETLSTLAEHGVRTLRTDDDGTVTIDVQRGTVAVATGN